MTDSVIGITSIDRKYEFVSFSDNTIGAVTTMFDEDGDDTSDPSQCVAIICEHNIRGPIYVELMDEFACRVTHQ